MVGPAFVLRSGNHGEPTSSDLRQPPFQRLRQRTNAPPYCRSKTLMLSFQPGYGVAVAGEIFHLDETGT